METRTTIIIFVIIALLVGFGLGWFAKSEMDKTNPTGTYLAQVGRQPFRHVVQIPLNNETSYNGSKVDLVVITDKNGKIVPFLNPRLLRSGPNDTILTGQAASGGLYMLQELRGPGYRLAAPAHLTNAQMRPIIVPA